MPVTRVARVVSSGQPRTHSIDSAEVVSSIFVKAGIFILVSVAGSLST